MDKTDLINVASQGPRVRKETGRDMRGSQNIARDATDSLCRLMCAFSSAETACVC
jgi:hypothetical protein